MKRYFIACAIILSFCSLGYAEKRTKVTGFVFQEDTTGVRSPVVGLLVKLNRPGEENTATSKGYFEIQTSVDGYVGEKIIFHIDRKGWVIKTPANGVYIIPKFSDIIRAEILLVHEGDKSLLNHAQIMAFLYDEVARLSKATVENRDTEFAKLLTEYSKRLKIKEKDLQQAIDGWIKNVKTPEEKALAAFHRRDFDETISEANKILRESVNIRKLKADALLAKSDYAAAEEEYEIIIHDAPTHAEAINAISVILFNIAKYEEALSHYDRYLPALKTRYGENSTEVATALNNIAGVLGSKGDHAGALEKYNEALKIDETYFDHNHPNVARELNNIAGVLYLKGDYAGALEKYDEALAMFMKLLGHEHPNTRAVADSRLRALRLLPENERWQYNTRSYLALLTNILNENGRLILLGQVAAGFLKQAKAESALIYLERAMPLAQKLNVQETMGAILSNSGLTHKSLKHWVKAEQYLQQSLAYNRRVQGDSAAVLAYTYFHLAGVAQAEGQTDLSREYAQKSLMLAERHKLTELRAEVEALLKQIR